MENFGYYGFPDLYDNDKPLNRIFYGLCFVFFRKVHFMLILLMTSTFIGLMLTVKIIVLHIFENFENFWRCCKI